MKRLNFSAARRVFAHAIATMHADRLKRLGPTSPAYHAYHVARMKGDWKAYGAAFDAFTRADHAANDADLEAVVAAEMMERKNERQAAD